ncbi:cell division protein SepF [Clostridium tyrobutyricum]|jgi:cell division inhibitor SepF|uniref:Cell division protein SepF n=1 Tax=Clostridium tyrobutyricum DIVETGP TaxID=1408889 RepID=W6N1R1_CLOTY|nr:cell division protein SepF [Clostridium tyrobutyricum]AND85241.1 cell division protein sepF [Clostridium tyrobutyricum]ANP69798.1 cell division protein SepF [Clostridium tyrobutyricum]MBR9646889.1 cell division protein SepF [Clostridium tyrobutyricum]MBV4415244.1 cell division protein SepF [Clostridium tyrobutyricum]MBV4419102.1 cell division protein SepF [Clostridium tyrobutyricum]
MASKMLNKMMGFLGLEDDLEDEVEEFEETDNKKAVNDFEEVEPVINSKRQNKVVSIHTTISAKIRIVKPTTYEEAADICDELKNRKIVVINTTGLENRVAQRLLDFMGGSSYSLGGSLEEIEKGVYILSPASVEVSNDLKNELSGKGLFNWK